MKERLQKLIARSGMASRRTAEEWIETGLVQVNGEVAGLGDKADLSRDRVVVKGRRLEVAEEKITVLLNKPRGYVTTMHDPQQRKTVTELVQDIPARLFPVGRLDLNTEGLLLLTNDGDLAQIIAHPRFYVRKTYLVKARGQFTTATRNELEQGVKLADGLTAAAQVARVRRHGANVWFELTLHEGRNRQVRRMCEAVGLSVVRLKRIKLAMLDLGGVETGRYRRLNAAEIAMLKKINKHKNIS